MRSLLLFLMFFPLVVSGAPPEGYRQAIPATMCWFRIDYLGIPKDLNTKKLLFIEVEKKEYILPGGFNRPFKNYLDDYPYDAKVYKRKNLLKFLKGDPVEKHFDYQLRIGFDGDYYYALIEDLHSGLRYTAETRARVTVQGSLKRLMRLVEENPGEPEYYPFPSDALSNCQKDKRIGTLGPAIARCPDFDYLGFPEDLEEKGLVYLPIKKGEKRNWKVINRPLKGPLMRKYPFSARLLESKESELKPNEKYQLRVGYYNQFYTLYLPSPAGGGSVHTGREDNFFLIIEEIETGKRWVPRPSPTLPLALTSGFLKELKKFY